MQSGFDPAHAAMGDVGTAMFLIDSQLRALHDDAGEPDPAQRRLTDELLRSFDGEAAMDVLDGACTLIYLFVRWLREAHEDEDYDIVEDVVPYIVATLTTMTRSVRPEGIPTMAGLLVASATDQSPSLWRRQFGPWTPAEMTALEATTFLLAHYINKLTQDDDTATRMIMELLASVEEADDAPGRP